MKIYGLLAVIVLVGCASEPTAPAHKTQEVHAKIYDGGEVTHEEGLESLTDKQKIQLLRNEAKKQHIHWRVFCTSYYLEDAESFQGWAIPSRAEFSATQASGYIEEGAVPDWSSTGTTQADTAYALYQAIRREPNHYPEHRPKDNRKAKMCKPEIGG